jgi:hypothetical protein
MHHTNRVRPFIIADDGRLADVSICEQAERDCACFWFSFELMDNDQRKKNSI